MTSRSRGEERLVDQAGAILCASRALLCEAEIKTEERSVAVEPRALRWTTAEWPTL